MKDSIILSREFHFPPHKVWEALTDSQALERWLMPNTFALRPGAEFTFRSSPAPGFDGVVKCRILEYEVERFLRYTWEGGGLNTVVEWRLEETESGTRLTLTHSGFRGLKASLIKRILGSGWRSMLLGDKFNDLLKVLL